MEKQIPIMKQSIELSSTILEGLQHIQKLLNTGKYEDTVYLFEDIITAFATVEQSLVPIIEKMNGENIQSQGVQKALELAVSQYEAKNYSKIQEILQFTLIPQVRKWKAGMESEFAPYFVS